VLAAVFGSFIFPRFFLIVKGGEPEEDPPRRLLLYYFPFFPSADVWDSPPFFPFLSLPSGRVIGMVSPPTVPDRKKLEQRILQTGQEETALSSRWWQAPTSLFADHAGFAAQVSRSLTSSLGWKEMVSPLLLPSRSSSQHRPFEKFLQRTQFNIQLEQGTLLPPPVSPIFPSPHL